MKLLDKLFNKTVCIHCANHRWSDHVDDTNINLWHNHECGARVRVPEHIDYTTGEVVPAVYHHCRDINDLGECPYFVDKGD